MKDEADAKKKEADAKKTEVAENKEKRMVAKRNARLRHASTLEAGAAKKKSKLPGAAKTPSKHFDPPSGNYLGDPDEPGGELSPDYSKEDLYNKLNCLHCKFQKSTKRDMIADGKSLEDAIEEARIAGKATKGKFLAALAPSTLK